MKLHEEFHIEQPVDAVWRFFEQPESVASCMPGVESVTVLDEDNVDVRATQRIGPMSATFEARVTVFERVENEQISFRAVGRSVRGAAGNLRTTNVVRLAGSNGSTTVAVDGDVALAGALGSVGQKVVAKQAGKVTAEFAQNLQRALNGEPLPKRATRRPVAEATGEDADTNTYTTGLSGDPWARVAAGLSAVSVVLSLISLLRSRHRAGNAR